MLSRLIDRGWLRRVIEFTLVDGSHVVEYDGRGVGYETLKVDGIVIRKMDWLWFVPRFNSKLGGWPLIVEVRVWPWFLLRSLVIRVDGQIVYAEGLGGWAKQQARGLDDWDDLV